MVTVIAISYLSILAQIMENNPAIYAEINRF